MAHQLPSRPVPRGSAALGVGLSVWLLAAPAGARRAAVEISKLPPSTTVPLGRQARAPAAPAAHASQQAYVKARDAARAVLALPERRRSKKLYTDTIFTLEHVARSFPQAVEAPRALFLAGDLYRAQFEAGRRPQDADAALLRYARVCRDYPQASLADDAMWARAEIYMQQRRRNLAQTEIELLLERYPQGDMAPRARAMAALLRSTLARAAPQSDAAKGQFTTVSFTPQPTRIAPNQALPNGEANTSRRRGAMRAASPSAAPQQVVQRRRVVIDPGHGGHDSGAVGPDGTYEKHVVLAIAHQAQSLLLAHNVDVILTRSDDTFISLKERTHIANRLQADAFVSVHANSAPHSEAHGIETYTLDIASDRYAVRLAALENKTSEQEVTDLQLILADLSTKANSHDSVLLAQGMQHKMVKAAQNHDPHARDLGVKASLFYVLLGAHMPSILVETAFVSNPHEERLLRQPGYQQRLGQAICDAVLDYLQKLEHAPKF